MTLPKQINFTIFLRSIFPVSCVVNPGVSKLWILKTQIFEKIKEWLPVTQAVLRVCCDTLMKCGRDVSSMESRQGE
jgi:hypothetical protein